MAVSFSLKDLTDSGFVLVKHNTMKIRDSFLSVADHGSWVLLSKSEFDDLSSGNIDVDSALFKQLKERGFIVTNSNFDDVCGLYRKRMDFMNFGVSLHIVVVTQRCNHHCVYCHARPKELSETGYDMTRPVAEKNS